MLPYARHLAGTMRAGHFVNSRNAFERSSRQRRRAFERFVMSEMKHVEKITGVGMPREASDEAVQARCKVDPIFRDAVARITNARVKLLGY
ncbi:hypothetical protein GCM10011392_03160 [Wenxinia marina]|uniref:Uncharacterized protein n=1 Tax=Wenxinia marina DSM 24838 TaxID=1123501 RepID=A0A0D0PGU2_9RHOB|nr:hypothetical protein Wenmar_00933 [Wenxinia marina DSM 24838]GGL52182.1 hypothetical protein GCM10011392_03160 [Wenxinia marina]